MVAYQLDATKKTSFISKCSRGEKQGGLQSVFNVGSVDEPLKLGVADFRHSDEIVRRGLEDEQYS